MTLDKIKEAVLRAEGYAEGFRAGFTSCSQWLVGELEKERTAGIQVSPGSTDSKPEGS